MRNLFKKSLALILALTMVFSAAPLAGLVGLELPKIGEIFAEKAEAATYGVLSYEITDGEVAITDCDTSASGALEIPATIEGYPVTSIGDSAFEFCESLIGVTIPNSVTSIRDEAFYHCTGLTSVTIPDSVTSIGRGAFYDTGIYNDESNWENGVLYIGNHLIKAKDTVSGDYAIKSGTKTIADEAFANCASLTSIIIPAGVTNIGGAAFNNCNSLTSVTIPASVIRIGYSAFCSCTSLTSISIPDSVMYIENGAFGNTGIYNDESNWENDVLYIGNYLVGVKTTVTGDYAIKPGTKVIIDKAFYGCDSLTSITIPDSVAGIGKYAFIFCTGLESITVDINNSCYSSDEYGVLFNKDKTELIKYPAGNARTAYDIPDGVANICSDAFRVCDSLESVTMPDSVTNIDDGAFYGSSNLKNINISNSITVIKSVTFYGCLSLESIEIPDGVTSIQDIAFSNCKNLKSIIIPDSVITIDWRAFEGCAGLTSVSIPESVTSIEDLAFSGCESLTGITVDEKNQYYSSDKYGVLFNKDKTELIKYPEGSTRTAYDIPAGVTIIGDDAFCWCENLTSVTIPAGVTRIGDYAFSECTSLKSISIPAGVTSIGDSAFYACENLASITIPDSVMYIHEWAFEDCACLSDVYYSGSKEQWEEIYIGSRNSGITNATIHFNFIGIPLPITYKISDGEVKITGCDTSASGTLEIPATIEGYPVTSIGNWAFEDCTGLTSITIPDSIISIGLGAFYNCTGFSSITIPESVTSIDEGAFCGCTGLTKIVIPEGITKISGPMFADCSKLTSITIPDSVTEIGAGAFSNCISLASITIPESVTIIGEEAFFNTRIYNDESNWENDVLYIGKNLIKAKESIIGDCKIKPGTKVIADSAFDECKKLTSITIPNSVIGIGNCAFWGCSNLTGVTIPDGVPSIGAQTFRKCTSLTNVTIGNGVTNIEYGAFMSCTNLTSISIPDSVTSIGLSAFYYCNSLKTVYYTGSPESWKAISIDDENEPLLNAEIIYGSSGSEGGGEDPVITPVIAIRTPSRTAINYGDSIILHADTAERPPVGAYYEWTFSDGGVFDSTVSESGNELKITPKKSGSTVITVTLRDLDGNVIGSDEVSMTAKAGVFEKIIGFIKKIFRRTKTFPQIFKGIF